MKQSVKQVQNQSLSLTFNLKNQIKLLSQSGEAVRYQLDKLIDKLHLEKNKDFFYFKDTILIDRYNKFLSKSNQDSTKNLEILEDKSLKKSLLGQLTLLNLKEHEYLIGEYLIDSVEENGRLDDKIDFDDIKSLVLSTFNINIDNKNIEQVLLKIQHLEPVGCCYRTVTESLILQTEYLDISRLEKDKIKATLDNIANGKMELKLLPSKDKKLIRQLNLSPGISINQPDKLYITPDVLAFRTQDGWKITLNDSFMSKALIEKIRSASKNASLKIKLETESFFKGLERRQQTLLLVTKYIVNKQTRFLDGKGKLVPITLKNIAQSVNASESTISRIVTSKYLQLPTTNISLRDLLIKRVNGRAKKDESVSPDQLVEMIQNLVNIEDKSKPLSDEKIRQSLKDKYAVCIARRTVSKYRNKANIVTQRERISI